MGGHSRSRDGLVGWQGAAIGEEPQQPPGWARGGKKQLPGWADGETHKLVLSERKTGSAVALGGSSNGAEVHVCVPTFAVRTHKQALSL